MESEQQFHNLFKHPDNLESFELFYRFLSQASQGLVLCIVSPNERLKIFNFFNRDKLGTHIHMVNMAEPLMDPLQLQQSILASNKTYGIKRNIFFIYNFESCIKKLKITPREFFHKMNLIRDFFMRFDARFVFFLSEELKNKLINHAFDFYDWMTMTFLFKTEEITSEISILHLSDIHFRMNKDDKDNKIVFRMQVREKLIKAIEIHIMENKPPDVVAVTGDIAFSGKDSEYIEALEFFAELKKILPEGIPFLIVPGNHDIDRDQVNIFFSLQDIIKRGMIDEFLNDKKKVKQFINVKFQSYNRFINQINPDLYHNKRDYFWVKSLEEKQVVFLGLNSAWASERNNEAFNIALGNWQVVQALEQTKHLPFRILLMHHPLFNWLDPVDTNKWSSVVFRKCQLLLHGHMHMDATFSMSTPSDSCICLGANACFTYDGHIGFQFINVKFSDNQTSVHVLPYISDSGALRDFYPDTRRWKGQENKPFYKIVTHHSCAKNDFSLPHLSIPQKYKDWIDKFRSLADVQNMDPDIYPFPNLLYDVYIPIEVTIPFNTLHNQVFKGENHLFVESMGEKIESSNIDIEVLLGRKKILFIRGDAGMGKTTILNHIAYTIIQGKGSIELCTFLPVFIFLKDFWLIYEKQKSITGNSSKTLFLSVLKIYVDSYWDVLKYGVIEDFLLKGRVLFLLDGLDEVPGKLRHVLVENLAIFREKYKNNRFLIASRPHGIDRTVMKYFGEFIFDIKPLDDQKVNNFIVKWFQFKSGKAVGIAANTARELIEDIKNSELLKEFTKNPMFLTAVCVFYIKKDRYPHNRTKLYHPLVVNFLYRRFNHLPQEEVLKISKFLRKLAFHMHRHTLKTIAVGEVKTILKDVFQQTKKDESMGQYNYRIHSLFIQIETNSGLLKRRGEGDLEFFYLTFQEFLAACYINDNDLDCLEFLENPWWEEVLLLYISLVNQEWKDKSNQLVRKIFSRSIRNKKNQHRIWLMGSKALRDIHDYRKDSDTIHLARKNLNKIIIDSHSSLENRFEAGEFLAIFGDPRINVFDPEMIHIPAGKFIRGLDRGHDEEPKREIELDEFYIGKYLVTNQEYHAFIEAGGYRSREFWTPEGWTWREANNIIEPRFYHNGNWNGANFPVVGINWNEAFAYIQWLHKETGLKYTLPSEAQWEKAARGTGGWIFPWGNKFYKNRCNSFESGLGRTSPVGIFPSGISPFGCMDIAGNVLEWCWDWYQVDYYQDSPYCNPKGPREGSFRVLRGGNWNFNRGGCRTTCRHKGIPSHRNSGIGFRLCRCS